MSVIDEQEPSAVTSTDTTTNKDATLSGEERQIAIRLTTQDSQYEIPATKFLVPASWRRFHLSQLINKVLNKDGSSSTPFDFLINQSLLRSSLGAYCAQSGVSEEVTLEIEYLPSTLPPQLESTLPAQDWVSDVSLGVKGAILTSSYAGTLSYTSTLSTSLSPLTFEGHDLSVLSCCYVHNPAGQSSPSAETGWVASGGMDRIGRVWSYTTSSSSPSLLPSSDPLPVPQTLYTLSLHTGPISSVRGRPLPSSLADPMPAPHLLTGGWDGIIGVWDLTKGVNEGDALREDADGSERKRKRRRHAPGSVINKTPISALSGHSSKISRAIFASSLSTPHLAYSSSFDHTLRTWDLSVAQLISTRTAPSSSVLLDLAQLSSKNLLITGSTDRSVGLWDTREDALSHISVSLTGHTGPVSSVVAHPTEALLMASGSYDGTVKVWDARSPKQALFTLSMPSESEEDKVGSSATPEKILSIDWDGERLVAAGEGAKVALWRVSGSKGVEAQ